MVSNIIQDDTKDSLSDVDCAISKLKPLEYGMW